MALNGILFVLRTSIPWEELSQKLGFGSGITCWRWLRQWRAARGWHRLHLLLLAQLRSTGRLDFSRASLDAASVPCPQGLAHEPQWARLKRRGGVSSATTGWVAIAGTWSTRMPGWLPSASRASASSKAPVLMWRCFPGLAASSASDPR